MQNQVTIKTVTMTSLELVEFINSQRKDGEAELRHRDFTVKVPKVLGDEMSEKFRTSLKDSYGRDQPGYSFPKREACLMAMSYSYEIQAKVFDRMTELEEMVAKEFLIEQKAKPKRAEGLSRTQISMGLSLLRGAAKDLGLPPSAILGGYHRLEAMIGITGLLPAYAIDAPANSGAVSSDVTLPLKTLLPKFNVDMSPVAFNQLLIAKGFLEERIRPSTGGTEKSFKSVLNLEYGKNVTSPHNPRETQPHWYESKFRALLDIVLPKAANDSAPSDDAA